MLDVNGQSIGDGTLELVKFAETASAVNEITVTNSATGNAPELSATGDDTDIDLKLTPKGAGKLNLDGIKFPNADGTANQVLKTDGSGVLSFTTLTSDGTADWDTSVKTTGFTATANKGYFCNTTSAAFTVTLPATPSAGDEVILVDYAGTWDTNNLTIDPNSGKILAQTSNVIASKDREAFRLVYIDNTQGWIPYSGYQESTAGLSIPYSVDFLVIAGGGGGGEGTAGGGGGAGGYRNSFSTETSGGGGSSESSLTFIAGTTYTITIGSGGAGSAGTGKGTSGSNSSISGTGLTTITSTGGGGGGAEGSSNGLNGGSGGGTGRSGTAGTGTANQGFDGVSGADAAIGYFGGGGGGAGSAAVARSGTTGSAGGNGLASSITGSSVTRAGGGGGATQNLPGNTLTGGLGGSGGGGNGSTDNVAGAGTQSGGDGTVNRGSGGGGGPDLSNSGQRGGNGSSGVIILRIPTANYSGTTTGSPTVTTDGSDTILVYNASGSYTG
jgi:hypothetical protein